MSRDGSSAPALVARAYPPAKLNLFLELLGRRDDGYHDIDTVMVPIDWRDELTVRFRDDDSIHLKVDWVPSARNIAEQLGVDSDEPFASPLLRIPTDASNLVYRALDRFRTAYAVDRGFDVELKKQIPAGAGMGGASSDAASALQCAARLSGIALDDPPLLGLAAGIGSDVPFFMGLERGSDLSAARATGRGEHLQRVHLECPLFVVVVFPAISLSTAEVYSFAQLPNDAGSPEGLIRKLGREVRSFETDDLVNRLAEPSKKLAPRIGEVLESLKQLGVSACQMTGSGSACFAITESLEQAEEVADQMRTAWQPGALIRSATTVNAPAWIEMITLDET
ncbi:MAG: 4-(cytidine 5'-diphospho)-2-C-methyl-D-erythritol kinase [Planctomycetota bacterium]